MWRFLTPVSGSQQGEAAKVEPSSSQTLSPAGNMLVEKGDSSQRGVFADIKRAFRGRVLHGVSSVSWSWIHPHPLLNKLLLVYEVPRRWIRAWIEHNSVKSRNVLSDEAANLYVGSKKRDTRAEPG